LDKTGFRGGGFVGFNYQINAFVLGLEGDFGWADSERTFVGNAYPLVLRGTATSDATFFLKTTWDASIRGRLGVVPLPGVLVYGTAGAAWIHTEATSTCASFPGAACGGVNGGITAISPFLPVAVTETETRIGWTAGGGADVILGGGFFLRAEYRYSDYGKATYTETRTGGVVSFTPFFPFGPTFVGPPGTAKINYSLALQSHTTKFGLGYKF
jgi:outer membrane immunogenic protein